MIDDVKELIEEGLKKSHLGQFEEANRYYDRAIELEPHNAAAWNNRGLALSELGQYAKAILSFEKALELTPNDPRIWMGNGAVLVRLDRINEALRCYNKAIKLDRKNSEAIFNKGYLEKMSGNPRKAYKLFKRYIALNPSKQAVQLNYAKRHIATRGHHTETGEEIPLRRAAKNRRANIAVRLVLVVFTLLLAGFGYALTRLSPWFWLVTGPLIFTAVSIFISQVLNWKSCPQCKKQIRAITAVGIQVCPRCGTEFALSGVKK